MHTRHVIAVALTTLALAAPSAALSTAVAAGDHAPKAQTKQLLKDIAGKDERLARLAEGNAVDRLADDTQGELVANITEARAALAAIKAAAEAADSTMDTRAARKDLHAVRVENFGQVISILRKAEDLSEAAATDPEAQAHLDMAEDAALAITATSSKSDVRAAREHLRDTRTELEATTTPAV
jgi:hypothetical protein